MSDNKDLLDEIDKLEDNEDVVKEKSEQPTSHEKIFTVVIVIIIIIALAMLYLFYKGNYRVSSNKKNAKEDLSTYLEGFYDYTNEDFDDEDEEFDDYDDYADYDEYNEQKRQAIEKFETQKANLTITNQSMSVDNELIIGIHNGNQERVSDLSVQVIFYDAENKPIKIDDDYIDIEANMDYYITFYETPKEYARYDFLLTKDFLPEEIYISHKNDISFETKDTTTEIEITGKNNSNEEIDYIEFEVVYYNENNQIIGAEVSAEYEIEAGSDFELVFDRNLYKYENDEEVPVARYEVILQDAYTIVEEI